MLTVSKWCEDVTGLGPGTLCRNAAMLHLDTPLLEQKSTKKLYGAKNNYVPVQLGQILDKKIHRDQEA